MRYIFSVLSNLIIKHPVLVIVVMVLITAVFGGFATRSVNVMETSTDDNEITRALDTISDVFGEPTSVLQILFESDTDIRSANALNTAISIESVIRESDAAATLIAEDAQPAIVSFLSGVVQETGTSGIDPSLIDDDMVLTLYQQALENLPPQFAGLLESLVGIGEPPTSGLMIVFQDTTGLDDTSALEQQRTLANIINTVDAPEGLTVTSFSFGLLLTAGDPGPEIGRLFGTALLIILLVLATVYWIRPPAGQRWRIIRRTAIDVGLSLTVIIMAVVWMQGIGVILGPDFLDLIDYFSPQTQIVPILIVGLGVDFAIHLLGRYRFEAGSSGNPGKALRIAIATTGFTLMLATGATAIGFLTNLSSPVSFLATLGVLAAVGIVAAFLLAVTFLPAIRLMLDRRAARSGQLPVEALAGQSNKTLPRIAGRTAWLALHIPIPVVVIAALLMGLGGYGFTQLESEFNLTDFVPKGEPLLATYDRLVDQFDGGFEERTQVLVNIEAPSPAGHNALVAAIVSSGDVPGVQKIGDFADANSIVSLLGQSYASELAPELAVLGVKEDLTVSDETDVEALYDLLISQAPGADQVLARGPDGTFLSLVDIRTIAGQEGLNTLVVGLEQAFAAIESADMSFIVTSMDIAQARQSETIEDSQIMSLLIALGGAMLLLVVHYTIYARRPLLGVITILPVGLVLFLTFGTMAITGIPINPVTATLAALSIGIGVPFMIHLTSRFLEERARTADCRLALTRTVSQTGGALAGSALTTAVGFGILISSTLIPFQQLGYVIVFAISYSLIVAILVLPSMLALWHSWDRRRLGQRGSCKTAIRDSRNLGSAQTGHIACPICNSKTSVRTAKKGPNKGKRFHVCNRYPSCKGKIAV